MAKKDIKRDEHGNINNIIDTLNYPMNNEIDSHSTSQKSSYNNLEKNDKKYNNENNNKLGKVVEENQESFYDHEQNKKAFTITNDKNSSKNFDIKEFDYDNTITQFEIDAPLVPPHLTKIPFVMVKKHYFS